MSKAGPTRVLVLTSTFPRHDNDVIPPFVLRLCQALQQEEGWESLVLAPHEKGLPVRDDVEGVTCHRFRYAPAALEQLAYGGGMLANVRAARWRWMLLPGFLLAQFMAAAMRLVRGPEMVLHAHWIIPQGLVAAMLKRLLWWRRIPLVITAHGSDLHADLGPLVRRLLLWALRQADVVTAVSRPMCGQLVAMGVAPDRIVLGPMGVDTRRFCPPEAAVRREGLVYVGRLVDKKGVEHLLAACALLLPIQPGLRLTLVGDGPLRATLEARSQALGLHGHVTFLGACPPAEVPRHMQAAALCVMPSLEEGLGLVVAEAMACGCSVVASDLPAIGDLLAHESTGLVVPSGDPAALAAAIARLLRDPELASRLSAAALSHAQGAFSWERVARNYAHAYRQACAGVVSAQD